MKKISMDADDREIARYMYRSSLVSVIWAVVSGRGNIRGFKQELADALEIDKSAVSRWFNGVPNWEANTVADIANALDIDLEIVAVDRKTGQRFTHNGAPATAVARTIGAPHKVTGSVQITGTSQPHAPRSAAA